jgi:hypothetical protein
MHKVTVAHMAGYFDAKGCVGIYCKKGYYSLRTSMMKKKDEESEIFFRRVQDRYSGTLCVVDVPNVGTFYSWQLTGAKAQKFLRKIYPYARLKREQIRLALEWRRKRDKTDEHYASALKAMKRGIISVNG